MDDYTEKLLGLIDGFQYETCYECQHELDKHVLGPDPLGNPFAFCLIPMGV